VPLIQLILRGNRGRLKYASVQRSTAFIASTIGESGSQQKCEIGDFLEQFA
jgi:hypothetical protein